jgi:hypothetical protein
MPLICVEWPTVTAWFFRARLNEMLGFVRRGKQRKRIFGQLVMAWWAQLFYTCEAIIVILDMSEQNFALSFDR